MHETIRMIAPGTRERSANDRLKEGWRARFWGSLLLAVGAHFAVFQLWPQMAVAMPVDDTGDEMVYLQPPETDIPPPPERLTKPARPIVSELGPVDAPEFSTDWADNPPQGPPPPEQSRDAEATGTPFAVAMDVPPRLTNSAEVTRILEREYPPLLRDAGIQGQVRVWFYIDQDGAVVDTRVHETSGQAGLDAAALRVADRMRFSPALNRDRPVAVWVSIPITFRVR
jgi:protein TonB